MSTTQSNNIWADFGAPKHVQNRITQEEIDVLLDGIEKSHATLLETELDGEEKVVYFDSTTKQIMNPTSTLPQSYGANYKYVNGKAVPLTTTEKERRARLRDKKMCWVEFTFGLVRYWMSALFVAPLKAAHAKYTYTLAHEPQPVQSTPLPPVQPQQVARPMKMTSAEHMNRVDVPKLAYFALAMWIGFTASAVTLSTMGLITL